jgi:hypothetical protein
MGGLFLPIIGPSSDVAWSAERGARAARAGDSPRRLRNARPLEQAHQALLPQRLSPAHLSRVSLLALPLVLLIPFFSLPPSPFPSPSSVPVPVTASSNILVPSYPPFLMDRWMGMLMLKSWCTCTGAQRHHVCCVDIKLPGDKEQGGNANVSASFNMLEERIRSRHSNIKNSSVPSLHHHTTLTGIFLAQRGIAAPCHRRNLGNNFRGNHRCGQKQHHRAHVCREH